MDQKFTTNTNSVYNNISAGMATAHIRLRELYAKQGAFLGNNVRMARALSDLFDEKIQFYEKKFAINIDEARMSNADMKTIEKSSKRKMAFEIAEKILEDDNFAFEEINQWQNRRSPLQEYSMTLPILLWKGE